MNIYLILIPSFLIFDYLITTIVRVFNLKALDTSLPSEFKDIFDNFPPPTSPLAGNIPNVRYDSFEPSWRCCCYE